MAQKMDKANVALVGSVPGCTLGIEPTAAVSSGKGVQASNGNNDSDSGGGGGGNNNNDAEEADDSVGSPDAMAMTLNGWLALGVDIGVVDRPAVAALGEASVDGHAAAQIWETTAAADQTLQLAAGFPRALAALATQRFPHEPTAAVSSARLAEEYIAPLVRAMDNL